ncbi:2-(R)-hydroxypropyl-CoM dehydrogenase [Paenibacillus polymyxa E681]|uniref:SDR family NAD(P)-dependent oxidoreductase n=1 Tax=Paenibacillus polymyxa TaxID=1406 RepID=UPI0001E31241|nr:SDR family NAD(P)-dependent oxidoreductase [Paenibacillus polymyxa]ADM68389.1 short-chain dehydrogenase [Paenibacillus polymyxa E681]QNV55389.1 2-(R)-hydroxypropyl-CoM dehydrogenase [Paenibacillus polymyxa E681]QNV60225.1 2-(R)-hydroxypropyl-CoM dehydrogenase [Paenibacillus polymyxa E681]
MSSTKIWFVTGASKGMGLALVKKILAGGARVAATSRNVDDLEEAVGKHEYFLPIQLNLSDEQAVKEAISATIEYFGGLDVVVNNAGYGQVGVFEEITDEYVRRNFEANVFGTFNVVRQALPQLRQQRSGHIINFSSTAGFFGFGGSSIYAATKFAVDGMSEALAQDVQPFGIHVTAVKPGYFRTNFLSKGSLGVNSVNPIEDYKEQREAQETAVSAYDNNQPGDPEKAVDLLIRITESPNPPLHLFLGKDAYEVARNKISSIQKDLEAGESEATATDFS